MVTCQSMRVRPLEQMYHSGEDADNRGGGAFVGVGGMREVSALSAQSRCEPKTALKSKVFFFFKVILQWFLVEQPPHDPLNEVGFIFPNSARGVLTSLRVTYSFEHPMKVYILFP